MMHTKSILTALLLLAILLVTTQCTSDTNTPAEVPQVEAEVTTNEFGEEIIDGIHKTTGLVYAEGFEAIRKNCLSCHSAELITQNRATAEGWQEMIKWMQATQNLHDMGTDEPEVIAYLAKHYAPENVGRRKNLDMESIEWYMLEE